MANSFGIKIIKFLRSKGPSNVTTIAKHFRQNRTTISYQLNKLEDEDLISSHKQGRSVIYTTLSPHQIEQVYQEKIKQLERDLQEIKSAEPVVFNKDGGSREKPNLVITNYYDFTKGALEEISNYYNVTNYSDKELIISQKELIERCKNAEVIVANWPCELDSQTISKLPKLKYIHTTTHMYKYIDVKSLENHGIRLSNIPTAEYKSNALIEFMLAQTFAMQRPVAIAADQTRVGVKEFIGHKGSQLRGKTAGIIGGGTVARELGNILKTLGLQVMHYKPGDDEKPESWGVPRFNSLREIAEGSDFIYFSSRSVVKQYSDLNLDESFLKYIKQDASIISITKHDYIDYKLIRELIIDRHLKAIALDYVDALVEVEGFKDSPTKLIHNLPNVFITPDIAWYTEESIESMNMYSNRALIAYAKGDMSHMII